MGPFDDLTEAQRRQIREAHAAREEREMRAAEQPSSSTTTSPSRAQQIAEVLAGDEDSATVTITKAEFDCVVSALALEYAELSSAMRERVRDELIAAVRATEREG